MSEKSDMNKARLAVDRLGEELTTDLTEQISKQNKFRDEMESLINRYSMENESDTPDFILARYMLRCLENFSITTRERDKYYER